MGERKMKNSIFWKGLVFGIIVFLFLGASIVPIAGSQSVEKNPTVLNPVNTGLLDYNITLSGTMGNNGWYISCVGISISGLQGDETIFYSIDGGAYVAYTAPITACTDGNYSFEAIVVDQNGNQTHLGPVYFHIDRTPPVVHLSAEKDHGKLKISGSAYDETSGLDCYQIFFGGQIMWWSQFQWPWGEQPICWVLSPIPHININITFVACDFAGNNGSASVPLSISKDRQVNCANTLTNLYQLFHNIFFNLILRHQMTR